MKRMNSIAINKVPRAVLLVILTISSALFLGSCGEDDDDGTPTMPASYTISGDAHGSQVVPGVSGTGSGTISGTYDPNTRVLAYTATWTGLSGPPISGGLYAGAAGFNGTAIGTPWSFPAEAAVAGSMTSSVTLTELQANALTSGKVYYTFDTAVNAAGEVRGQIAATASQESQNP